MESDSHKYIHTICLIILIILLSNRLINCVQVYEISSEKNPTSGFSLKNHPNTSLTESSICFRFINNHIQDQILFSFDHSCLFVGSTWSKLNDQSGSSTNELKWPENDDVITGIYLKILDPGIGVKILHFEFT